jgi:predicted HD superfamily hydrolase involved in NAD metabolism
MRQNISGKKAFTGEKMVLKRYDEIAALLREKLPEKRYNHTLGVAYLAAAIAMNYGEDYDSAMLAGMLHDCAKCYSDEFMVSECEKNNVMLTESEKRTPSLIHSKLGAYYAQTMYNVHDENILNAIRFHTTGRPRMTFLEKNIFLSDYIEVHRMQNTSPNLDIIRKTAFTDLDRAVLYALENTIGYLKANKYEIEHTTIDTYEYYKNLHK